MPTPLLARLAGGGALLALALGIGVPWWALLREASDPAGWRVLLEARVWERLVWTFTQALLSTLLALLLGLPAALAFGLARVPGARWWRAAFTVPFVMPSVVAGLAVLAWFGPRGLSGFDLRDSLAIVLIAHAVYNVGVVVRVVGGALEALAPRLHEAAAVLGASGLRRTLRVTLPLATPAALSAATLVFLFCFTSFGVILVLAPSPAFATLEVEVYRAVAVSITWTSWSHFSMGNSSSGATCCRPALLIRTSTGRSSEPQSASTLASLVTSSTRAVALPPAATISPATLAAAVSSRSVTTSSWPSRARWAAMPAPMPLPAPVIRICMVG